MPFDEENSARCRLLLAAERWQPRVPLEEHQRRYLVDVHRLSSGSAVEVFDGRGRRCQARLITVRGGWALELGAKEVFEARKAEVRLGVALTKGRKLDEVVRMATEIGVATLEPFTCQRSVPRPGGADAGRHRRWQAIAAEAARQSGQVWVPEIRPLTSLERLLASRGSGLGIMVHPQASIDVSRALAGGGSAGCLLLVGPEGGFSQAEVAAARRAGFQVARLALPVLQATTAAVVVAALACLDRSNGLG